MVWWLLIAPLAAATLAASLGGLSWVLELFTHFRPQYAVLAAAVALAAGVARSRAAAVAALAIALVNAAHVMPVYWAPDGRPAAWDGPSLRVFAANVHGANRSHAALRAAINEANPDVFVLSEVTPAWAQALLPLAREYPHQLNRPHPRFFGIVLWSRKPLLDTAVLDISPEACAPLLAATVDAGGQPVTVIGAHPSAPLIEKYADLRNQQLAALADVARKAGGSAMVIGDLNLTPWSPYFSRLVGHAGLRDSRRGFGNQPTWPSQLVWAGIPIDHCLVARSVVVLHRRVGPDVGSDHRPIVVDVAVMGGGEADGH